MRIPRSACARPCAASRPRMSTTTSPGAGDALLFAAAEAAHAPVAQRRDVEQVERLLHAPAHVRGLDAEVLHAVRELLLDPVQDERCDRVLRNERDDVGQAAWWMVDRVS